MAQTRQIGLFGVGECDGNLSEYPPTDRTEGSVIINTGEFGYMPIKIPLYYALRFFWGVKKLKITFNYNYNIDLSGGSYESGSYIKTSGTISVSGENGDSNNVVNQSVHNLAENERYLFCLADEPQVSGFRYAWEVPITYERKLIEIIDEETGETQTTEDTFTQNLTIEVASFYILQDASPPLFSKDESNSIENLWMSFFVQVDRRSAFPYFSNFFQFGEPEESIDATLAFLGQNYTIKLGTFSIDDESVTSEISDVVIEPTEWWSYDGLFDTSTGEKLDQ